MTAPSPHPDPAMIILRIEHPVPDFAAWKRAFDADPLGRARSGVRRYRILRSADAQFVTADLEFGTRDQATAMLGALEKLWGRVEGELIRRPQARILEPVEEREY